MSTSNVREALLEAIDASALPLWSEYVQRLHSEDASIDDLHKATKLILAAKGIGQTDKADTRVVVDIVFENGMIDTATPAHIEMLPQTLEFTDAVVKQAAEATGADFVPDVPTPTPAAKNAPEAQEFDFDDLFDNLTPLD